MVTVLTAVKLRSTYLAFHNSKHKRWEKTLTQTEFGMFIQTGSTGRLRTGYDLIEPHP